MANREHIEWLLEGVEAWNTRRESEDERLRGFKPDFSGARLQRIFGEQSKLDSDGRIPLAGADLPYADFSDSDLSKSDLRDAFLLDANLERANLEDALLQRSRLTGANLKSATLTNADLSKADLRGAVLSGAKFWDANLGETKFPDANVLTADLSGAEPWRAALFAEHRWVVEQCDVRLPKITTVNELMDEYKRLRQYHNEQSDRIGNVPPRRVPMRLAPPSSRTTQRWPTPP